MGAKRTGRTSETQIWKFIALLFSQKFFFKKSVIFDGFWRFFEVHTILAKYYRINSTDLFVKQFFGFFDTLGTPKGVQLSHG
jgi:hypothetical protein